MRSKYSIRVAAAFALLIAILSACQGFVPSSPASPGAVETIIYETAAAAQTQTARVITPTSIATLTNTPIPTSTATDVSLPTASLLPTDTKTMTVTATNTYTSTPTFTSTPTRTPTDTPLPPLPDFDEVLMYGGGAGGGTLAKEFCKDNNPWMFPASYGETSWGIDQIAYLCIWGVPLDVVFQVELISPNAEITLTGTFKALSSNHTIVWSGHVPDEHDSVVYIQDGVTTFVISPWWPRELPKGTWKMRVLWPGNEVFGIFESKDNTFIQSETHIYATDSRMKTEILPSGVVEQRLVHPGSAYKVFGAGFSPNSLIYLLIYADDQGGVYPFNPADKQFILVTGISVLTDHDGNFIANLHADLEQGKLYMLLGVTNPYADLSLSPPPFSYINYDEVEAEDLFYIQPLAPTFDFVSTSSSCPGAPPQRMVLNQRGYVCTKVDNVLLRNSPYRSGTAIDSLPVGTQFTVLDGPSCADNWSWWQIRTNYGTTGWIAEGGDNVDPYFICPLK